MGHPDKNIEQPELAEKMFKDVQSAYETLSDKKSRQEYDYGATHDLLGGGGNWRAEYPTGRAPGHQFNPFSRSRAQPEWNQPNPADFSEFFGNATAADPPESFSNAWSKGFRGRTW